MSNKIEQCVADLEFQLVEATRMVLKLAEEIYAGADEPWAYAPETGEWFLVSEGDEHALPMRWGSMRREQKARRALAKGGRDD